MMDNNLMLWTPTLGPLLEAFICDGINFYLMRWDNSDGTDIYSVLANPCGLTLIEIASNDTGGAASATDFNLIYASQTCSPREFYYQYYRRIGTNRCHLYRSVSAVLLERTTKWTGCYNFMVQTKMT